MASRNEICKKIEEIIPEAGKCDIDFQVNYNEQNHAWEVDLHDGSQHLKTFIEDVEADNCVDDNKCIPLGLQVGQLKRNLKLRREAGEQ